MDDRKTAEAIAAKIAEAGGRAYYVGGCVRDKLLKRPCKDLDIEVYGIPADTLEALLSAFGNVLTVGKSFGIFKLEHSSLDIALPRTEEKTGEGHRAFLTSADPYLPPETASSRRDFTVNALMEDVLSGEIHDYHNGLKDLGKGVLRHVNDASFSEDPLRVLRAARFAAQLGFDVAEETRELCRKIDLTSLSRERVEGETEKALLSREPDRYFAELREMGQLKDYYAELGDGPFFNKKALSLRKEAKNPVMYMLGILCSGIKETKREALLRRFLTKKYELKELKNWTYGEPADKVSLFEKLDQLEDPEDYVLVLRALFPEKENEYRKIGDEYQVFLRQEHIAGEDLFKLGYTPGKELGSLLKEIRKKEYTRSKEEILEELKK
ncbi:MAG: CCA tRNA nucleotidyltransferase [Erysipelotrichaceae bacterium]|nr:CCA tRNA nucleotidyltransferase [Erysipelotrichaceae bacterium]